MRSLLILAVLSVSAPVLAQEAPLALKDAIDKGVQASPRVREAEDALRAAEYQAKISLSPFLPSLSVEAGQLNEDGPNFNRSGPFVYGIGRWNVFNGGRDLWQRRSDRLRAERARIQRDLTRSQIARQVVRRYLQLMYFEGALALKTEALAINGEQRRLAQRKAHGGVTSNAEALEFEFRDNQLRTEIELLNHQRNMASRDLSVAMGLSPRSDLRTSGPLDKLQLPEELKDETAEIFMEQRALLDAQTDYDLAEQQRSSQLATWLPTVNLEARYGEMVFAEPEVEEGQPAWRVMALVAIPIFSGMETLYARRQAASQLRASEARLKDQRLQLESAKKDRTEKLQVIANLHRMQKENVARAERYFTATRSEYLRGIKNAPDLSGATQRLFDTRERHLQLARDLLLVRLGLTEAISFE